MLQLITFGKSITIPLLRDYIITHNVNEGDVIALNPQDLTVLINEIKQSDETIPDMPLKILGVVITHDTSDSVPIGKLQIVKNEKPYL